MLFCSAPQQEAHTFVTASNAEDVTEEKLGAAVAKVRPPAQPQRRSSVPVDKEEMVVSAD